MSGVRAESRRVTTSKIAVLGVLLLVAPVGTAAGVESAASETITVDGTVMHVVVDRHEPESGHAGDTAEELEVETFVQVDGALHPVPDDVALPDALTGDPVTMTVQVEPGASVDEALAAVAGEDDDVTAQVSDVSVFPSTTADEVGGEPMLNAAVAGSRTLLVLPVYWGAPDSATRASLQALADGTARYWAEQSGGSLAIRPVARDWAKIADPGTCNSSAIWSSALTAHGVRAAAGQHIAVYFPQRTDCGGWAGLASIGGGSIWINGAPLPDVLSHELGHNLGLGHANTARCTVGSTRVSLATPLGSACAISEYADRADVMGIGTTKVTGNLNTAFADHLGFAQVHPASTGTATLDLAPLANSTALRSIAVPVTDGTVYVDYRPAVGRDVRVPSWAGVQVHLRTIHPKHGYPTTYLLDMTPTTTTPFSTPALAVGRSWTVPGTSQTITVHSTGATARVSVGPTDQIAEVERYIANVYDDLFARPVDAAGLQTWTSRLLAGTPRVEVANGITGSDEYRSRLIAASYRTYLGRSPDPAGAEHWLRQMRQGMTIQAMEAGFVASPEYYQQSGSTSAGWVTRLYQQVLGRDPAASEVAHWQREMSAGMGPVQVALGFLLSTEHLTSVVDGHYVHLLGRHIDPSGRATWVTAIQRGTRVEAVIGGIVASPEYYGRS